MRATLILAAGFGFLVSALAGCGQPTTTVRSAATTHPARIISRASGVGSAYSPSFINPPGNWGIGWSYRCEHGRHGFGMSIFLPGIQGTVPQSYMGRSGTSGRGYKTETGNGHKVYSPGGHPAGSVLQVQIQTSCAWRIWVVKGKTATGNQYIPPLPNLTRTETVS